MTTAEEIQALITAAERDISQCDVDQERVRQETNQATERQRLRRKLDSLQSTLAVKRHVVKSQELYKKNVDADVSGAFAPENNGNTMRRSDENIQACNSTTDCADKVIEGKIDWTIKGFSWLEEAVKQTERTVCSGGICLGEHAFRLYYNSAGGEIGSHGQRASLAILHEELSELDGVTFRYKLFIRSKERGFVQWGNSGKVCTLDSADDMVFGPDVCTSGISSGIFNMSHAQLLTSEWVEDDKLTIRCVVQLRPNEDFVESDARVPFVRSMPSASHGEKLLQLFESGAHSDVTFIVQGEEIRAHSQILSAFSEVFQREFACGMQEALSKQVSIEDCDPTVFKAFLRYLYTERFESFDAANQECCSADGPDRLSLLRQLLALSHKYEEPRLQWWAENELCEHISVDAVCDLLCQAHLYGAKGLEEKCLDFIAANKNVVGKNVAFATLYQTWPEVGLKITLHLAQFSEEASAVAVTNQESSRKRKRDN